MSALRRWETAAFAVEPEVNAAFDAARARVAAFIGAPPAALSFNRNATDGNAQILSAFPWDEGDEVVTSRQEHPSLAYPTTYGAQRGHYTLRHFDIMGDPAQTLDNLQAVTGPRTRLITLSHVTSGTGTRTPVAEICRWAASAPFGRPIVTLIDGAQALGQFPVDVTALGCDAYAGNGHKWLCGPKGTGILYIKPTLLSLLWPAEVGAGSAASFSLTDGLHLAPTARRFEYGTRSLPIYSGLAMALDFWGEIPWSDRENRGRALADYLRQRLLDDVPGVQLITPRRWDDSSGLTTFDLPGVDAPALVERLRAHYRVLPRAIGACRVRVSTALYNAEEEIDRMIEGIRATVG
jgi:selenocysteine lyase/cysteine desulfurase